MQPKPVDEVLCTVTPIYYGDADYTHMHANFTYKHTPEWRDVKWNMEKNEVTTICNRRNVNKMKMIM